MSRSDLAVNYSILPDGEPPSGYEASAPRSISPPWGFQESISVRSTH